MVFLILPIWKFERTCSSSFNFRCLLVDCRDSIGASVVVGDTRWGGTFGVNADFVARTHCSVELITAKAIFVRILQCSSLASLFSLFNIVFAVYELSSLYVPQHIDVSVKFAVFTFVIIFFNV